MFDRLAVQGPTVINILSTRTRRWAIGLAAVPLLLGVIRRRGRPAAAWGAPTKGFQVDSTRKIAFVAGALFVITFLTSIPAALFLYSPVLNHPSYIVGAGADNRIALGALLEMILIIANIGSAVVLFRSSSGRTRASPLAMSPPVSLKAPSSPLASSASLRS